MKYLRPLLSVASVVFLYCWSRAVLPLRTKPMPFSGWGDGVDGNARNLSVPVTGFWLATVLALTFVCIKPDFQVERKAIRVARWLANTILSAVGVAVLFYAIHGPSVR